MSAARTEIDELLGRIRTVCPMMASATDRIGVICDSYFERDALHTFPPGLDQSAFTHSEAEILCLLYRRARMTCSKASIIGVTRRQDSAVEPDDSIVAVVICRIRKKLNGTPYEIETIRSRGYRLMVRPSEVQWHA